MTEPRRRRAGRVLAWIGGIVAVLVVLLTVGVIIWSQDGVLTAEPAPLAATRSDPAITVTSALEAIVMRPTADAGTEVGLVLIPGGKVQAEAYVARMAGLVADEGITVVITRPWLNLAFFDLRGLDTFTALAPEISTWIVGGHSLGGVRACSMVDDADALLLLASYCGADISEADVPVLSIAGSEDGLSTPGKVADSAHLLPDGAQLVEVRGASHASFGDYGPQAGDGTATITDEEMTEQVTQLVADFVASW